MPQPGLEHLDRRCIGAFLRGKHLRRPRRPGERGVHVGGDDDLLVCEAGIQAVQLQRLRPTQHPSAQLDGLPIEVQQLRPERPQRPRPTVGAGAATQSDDHP